jgi:hypothetical protein
MKAAVVAVLFLALPASAATFRAHVVRAIDSHRVMVRVQQVGSAGEIDLKEPPLPIELPADGSPVSTELPDGYWVATVDSETVWHAPQYFASTDDVIVELRPGKTVTGTVSTDDGRQVTQLSAQFPPEQQTDCAVREKRFRCTIPAEVSEIRLRARGYIARTVPVAPDIGNVALLHGQSITGRVAIGRNIRVDMHDVVVSVRPRNVARSIATAKPSANGSFRVDGVAPGEYVIHATAPMKRTSEEMVVTVIAGAESELARPLVVDDPHRVALSIVPRLAPSEVPWTVTVSRAISAERIDAVTSTSATKRGEWSARLRPGRYQLTVSAGEDRWSEQVIDVAGDLTLPLTIPMRTLRGRVLHGEEPLEADLQLSTVQNSVTTTTDADGRFELAVRAIDATWEARIAATAPPIERKISGLTLPPDGGELTIRLPKTTLSGMVVDANGRPRASSMVNVIRSADDVELIQLYADDEGRFATHALERGTYSVQADDGLEQSEPVAIAIGEDDVAAVRLVLREGREVRGRVVSAFGPVAGAHISIRAVNIPEAIVTSRTTDARGDFSFVLPPAADELDVRVAPPGFSYTIGRVRWQRGKPLLVGVDQRGGTIIARGPEGAVLRHAGAVEPVETLTQRWHAVVSEDGASTTIESMEPGAYSLCDAERCVHGFLAPHGSLTLALRP